MEKQNITNMNDISNELTFVPDCVPDGQEQTKKQKKAKRNFSEAREIVVYWVSNNLPEPHTVSPPLLQKIAVLLESVGADEIKLAIKNYSESPWHRDNGAFKALYSFMEKECIKIWQEPRKEFFKKTREEQVAPPSVNNELMNILNYMLRGYTE